MSLPGSCAARAYASRSSRNIAKIAAARVLFTQVFYGMRDGRVCSAARRAA
jgi:hypothetical protein